MKKAIDMPLIVKPRPSLIDPVATLEAHQVEPQPTADELAFLEEHAK